MTAREIREILRGEGRVYLRALFTRSTQRVLDARERKGELQVRTDDGWHTVLRQNTLMGDELWAEADEG